MTLQAHKIILIGMPGSGKSTLGRQLSDKTALPFIDLDYEIEKREVSTISDIFSTRGEKYFRKIESEILHEILMKSEFILATGGGTPCFFDNMSEIKEHGKSIFLNVPVEELIFRMTNIEKGKRPKLSSEKLDLQSIMQNLYESRLSYYQQADYEWDCSEPVEKLLKCIN